jgi:uncharacterized membrane protein YeaQ/YmgE (transglycosylase-associated protein family)
MTITGFLLMLAIAAVAGTIGQALSGYSLGGCIASILVGFLGAYIGAWISSQLQLPDFLMISIEGRDFPLFWAIVGSALFSTIVGWISRPRRVV